MGGKPSRTRLKVVAHLTSRRLGGSLSLVAVRISTGRRHQIRSHFSHVGHPTVRDGMYTASLTFEADRCFCTQNFLHRYRLVFKDANGVGCEATVPFPRALAS